MSVQRIEGARPVEGAEPQFRPPTPDDGSSMWELAAQVGLDVNSTYAYVLWGQYHADTSVVAVDPHDRLLGFVTGFRVPRSPDTVFVWQVAVADEWRGAKIATRILDELVAQTGARHVEATVTPSNGRSAALFRALGARHGGAVSERLMFGEELFPDDHEPEIRLRIGPLRRSHQATATG